MPTEPPDIHEYLRLLERAPETFRRSWDAIAVYDLEGRVLAGNAAAQAMIGADRAAELQSQHFTAHLTLEAATRAAREFAHCVTLGQTVDSHSVFVGADGEPIPVRMRLVPARVDGIVVGVIGFARDGRLRRDVEEQFMRTEQQFRSVFENHPDALALHDLAGRYIRVNAGMERLTGYSVEELIGQTPAMLMPGEWPDAERIRDGIARGETVDFEHHAILTKTGATREIDGRAVPLLVDGNVRGFCGMIRDVTDERRAARSSARQATRTADLYRIAASAGVAAEEKVTAALDAGMSELDAEWACVVRLNEDEFTVMHEAGAPAELDGERLRTALAQSDVFCVDDPARAPRALAGAAFSVEGRREGGIVFAKRGGPIAFSPGDRDYLRALAVLIGTAIQQGEREKHLDSLAFGDPLTGLPNRALLQDRLEQTLLSARRHRRSFAAHYIDIDHFKSINDTYGHQAGDAVLIAVAAWLRTALRDSDTIGRLGGDEFVVLQPEIDSQRQAEDLAEKLCTIRDERFQLGTREIRVTISVGCAVFPVDAENPVDMLRAADASLYEVKHRGRDGYAVGVVR